MPCPPQTLSPLFHTLQVFSLSTFSLSTCLDSRSRNLPQAFVNSSNSSLFVAPSEGGKTSANSSDLLSNLTYDLPLPGLSFMKLFHFCLECDWRNDGTLHWDLCSQCCRDRLLCPQIPLLTECRKDQQELKSSVQMIFGWSLRWFSQFSSD